MSGLPHGRKLVTQTTLTDRQIEIACSAFAEATVALVRRGEVEDLKVEATRIAEALVAGMGIIQGSCNTC